MAENPEREDRLGAALRFVLRRYAARIRQWPILAAGAFLLPAVGDVLTLYAPPLVVARLLGAFAEQPSADRRRTASLLARLRRAVGVRPDRLARGRGDDRPRSKSARSTALYIEAMDELLAKDLTFFHNNYAGSLTKRALGFARRFEDVFDVMAFQVSASFLPLVFAGVVLWQYSPWLIVVLVGHARDHVRADGAADPAPPHGWSTSARPRRTCSPATSRIRLPTPRPSAPSRARPRKRRSTNGTSATSAQRRCGPGTTRTRASTCSPRRCSCSRTSAGCIVALAVGSRTGASLEAVFLTFSYYATATRVMWEFNRIYRNLEGSLTDAAQFTELLLDPPGVVDRRRRSPSARPTSAWSCATSASDTALASRCCSTTFRCAIAPGRASVSSAARAAARRR